jgi:dihydroxyacetone kinase
MLLSGGYSTFRYSPADIVTGAIDALGRASGGSVAQLDGYPDVNVAVRAYAPSKQVAVISAGGAGHEPTHCGFVWEGMLNAAVSGESFASPSTEAVVAAIMSVTGEAGCLPAVKNRGGLVMSARSRKPG